MTLESQPSDLGARFRALFDAELRYVWTSLGRLGIDERDREDLASEVFFRVHRRMADLDPTRPARPWLFAFAVRVASEHRRRARTKNEALGAIDDAGASAIAPHASSGDEREVVARALEALDMDKRAVFVMHFLDGFTVPEVARALEIPLGTAYTRLRAAREIFTNAVRRTRKGER
jgi:RNA polymerase sigma-70 factor (ECF subfamily)